MLINQQHHVLLKVMSKKEMWDNWALPDGGAVQ